MNKRFNIRIHVDELIEEARQYILQRPQNKKEVFRALSSLNLMNAIIKQKEYKSVLSCSFIKPQVSRSVEFCISYSQEKYTDELFYDPQQHCMYIRCYGIQFSFQNIILTKTMQKIAHSALNIPIKWEGVRLQLIAVDLFVMAKQLALGYIEEGNIKDMFEDYNKLNQII